MDWVKTLERAWPDHGFVAPTFASRFVGACLLVALGLLWWIALGTLRRALERRGPAEHGRVGRSLCVLLVHGPWLLLATAWGFTVLARAFTSAWPAPRVYDFWASGGLQETPAHPAGALCAAVRIALAALLVSNVATAFLLPLLPVLARRHGLAFGPRTWVALASGLLAVLCCAASPDFRDWFLWWIGASVTPEGRRL